MRREEPVQGPHHHRPRLLDNLKSMLSFISPLSLSSSLLRKREPVQGLHRRPRLLVTIFVTIIVVTGKMMKSSRKPQNRHRPRLSVNFKPILLSLSSFVITTTTTTTPPSPSSSSSLPLQGLVQRPHLRRRPPLKTQTRQGAAGMPQVPPAPRG